ncbi:hypothetical protein V1389_01395 [Flavobacterium rakeshii]|uniref:hypothetical protein n=1 Tax=Flavobacterium rakeshii TaxID=1038845 RepID=UPI002E7ACD1C|nr:hypothetical protein [Flavobacterium rakeshii]MEE1896971.1 hypothetical protein [Flavobacterium rakeshii]
MKKRIKAILSGGESNTALKKKQTHQPLPTTPYIPENLTWILNLSTQDFSFIGKTEPFGPYAHLINITFNNFIELTKNCFIYTQLELIDYIVLKYPKLHNPAVNRPSLELLIPMRLTNEYFYVKQLIQPKTEHEIITALQIVNIPIKKYDNEPFRMVAFNNNRFCQQLYNEVQDHIKPPKLFTRQQLKNIVMIDNKLNSEQMAAKQNKTRAAIYKLNRKILETISNHFEIEFTTVAEAVNYFYQCYPAGRKQRFP